MATRNPKSAQATSRVKTPKATTAPGAPAVLAMLKKLATKTQRDSLARYGIPAEHAIGVSVADLHVIAKEVGRSHELALELWETGIYEARMLTAFVDEPSKVTPAQMERCCREFDSWAICDTLCFHLFDRTPHAYAMIPKWKDRKPEFEKRAAFALIASLALHDKKAPDAPFLDYLPWIEIASDDPRNFVKKAVLWALRGIGGRSPELHATALALAEKLAKSEPAPARFIGKSALRELKSPASLKRLAKQQSPARSPRSPR